MGTESGRSLEAAFRRAMEGSRDDMRELGSRWRECSGDGGDVGGSEGG